MNHLANTPAGENTNKHQRGIGISPKQLGVAFRVLITIGLLVFLFWNFNWNDFWALFKKIPGWFYFYSLGLILLGQVIYAYRWQVVLKSMNISLPFYQVAEQYFIAIFFNNFLPTSVGGDWARVYYLGQKEGYVNMGASVFVDRFLGLFLQTLLAVVLVWWLGGSSFAFLLAQFVLTLVCLAFIISILMAMFFPIEWLEQKVIASHARFALWVEVLHRFLKQIRYAGQKPTIIIGIASAVFVYYSFWAIIYSNFFKLTMHQTVHFWPMLAVMASIGVLANLPLTINGIGLREQLHYLLFAGLGISKEVAVSVSLLVFAHLLVASLIGYGLWIRLRIENSKNQKAVHLQSSKEV